MNVDAVPRLGILFLSSLVAVGGRFPSSDGWGVVAVVGGVMAAASAILSSWRRTSRLFAGAVFVSSLSTLLIPTSTEAWLAGAPPWAVGLLSVVALHVFLSDPHRAAPRVESTSSAGALPIRQTLRFAPVAIGAAVIIAAPVVMARILPLRISAAFELQAAMAPLVPLVFLSVLLAFLGALRGLRDRRTSEPRDSPAQTAAGGAPAMEVGPA